MDYGVEEVYTGVRNPNARRVGQYERGNNMLYQDSLIAESHAGPVRISSCSTQSKLKNGFWTRQSQATA